MSLMLIHEATRNKVAWVTKSDIFFLFIVPKRFERNKIVLFYKKERRTGLTERIPSCIVRMYDQKPFSRQL
jgi:hypothetical protein